ncbi:MAG: hypothetical protein AB8B81_19570 [Halioglobus sp.]
MKLKIALLACLTIIGACSDNSNRSSAIVEPPPPPPAEPPPGEPPAMQSFADFARTIFSERANNTPSEVNDLQFAQDAQGEDFEDLLQ